MLRRALLALGALLLALAALTFIALESGGVAIVETHAPDGSVRATHVWFVEHDGELWLEAGAPENSWFRDAERDPGVRVRIDGVASERRAEIVPEASPDVRARLHAKYGWRDAWVGLFVDATRSTAVRLREAEERE